MLFTAREIFRFARFFSDCVTLFTHKSYQFRSFRTVETLRRYDGLAFSAASRGPVIDIQFFERESSTNMASEMAPKQKGGPKPKVDTGEEVEETFQAVVCLTATQVARWLSLGYLFVFRPYSLT